MGILGSTSELFWSNKLDYISGNIGLASFWDFYSDVTVDWRGAISA